MQKLFYTLMLCSFLLAGCENNDLMQSDKKVREEIENKDWKRVAPSPNQDYKEIWHFSEGKGILYMVDDTLSFTYSIDSKFSSSYVTITGLPYPNTITGLENVNLNLKWTVAEISDKVLYLSAATESGTIKSLEYVIQ